MKLNLIVSVIIILGILFYLNKKTLLEGFTDAPGGPAEDHSAEVADIMGDLTRFKNLVEGKRNITPPTATENSSDFTGYIINFLPVRGFFSSYTSQISRMNAIREDLDDETVEEFEDLLEETDVEFLQMANNILNTMKLFHQAGAEIFNQMVINYFEFLSTSLSSLYSYSSSSLRPTIQENIGIINNAINPPTPSSTPSESTIPSTSSTPSASTTPSSSGTATSPNNIDENLLMEELLNIINTLNKRNVSETDRTRIKESLDNIENILLHATHNQFSDANKLLLLRKLLNESKTLFNQINNENTDLETVKALFGSNSGNRNYTQNPNIPNIAQFKPSGTSNIFSPVIEVKGGSNRNNRRYSNAYERGFEQGIQRAQNSLAGANIIDQSTSINETSIKAAVKGGDTTIDKSFKGILTGKGTVGYEDREGENNFSDRNNSTADNGYIRGDNRQNYQMPGYSYLNPELWNVPRKRTPVCYSMADMDRKENSLDPAGFVFGGPSNVMEFHGVGSIMPKFTYEEDVEEIENLGQI